MATTEEKLQRAWQVHQAGEYAQAEQVYRQVLQTEPNNANAWCYLGIACHDLDRFEEAVTCYQRAVRIQPNFPIAFNNMGNSLRLLRRLDESIACFDHALKLKPDYVNAHKNKGTALVWEGHVEAALASYERGLAIAPDDAETHKNLGVIRLLLGDFERGWPSYEWRWKTKDTALPDYDRPQWDGTSLDGKTILLTAEQGLGDTVHFVRYGAFLKARYNCRVVVASPKVLLPLLASTPGVDEWIDQKLPPPPFDVFAPLLNVPGILRHGLADFPTTVPYVFADESLVAEWGRKLAAYPDVKVGLAWQGNPKHHADRMRSVPLAEFAPLGKLRGVTFYSLQKGTGTEQLDTLGGRLDVINLGERLDEQTGAFVETAAVLKNLDLLITSDTAIAHVAGALGVPTWVALSFVPDWRWLMNRDDTPWYPSLRLFRQTKVGDWPSVLNSMAAALRAEFPAIGPKPPSDYRVTGTGFNRLGRSRYGLTLFNRHDMYIGKSLDHYGEFSEGEADVFRQLVRPGALVAEAGANIGTHTLVFAKLVGDKGQVHAFEPQRIVFQTLCANLALNSITNVFAHAQALGSQPGTTLVPALNYNAENNFGGLSLNNWTSGEETPVVTLDSLRLPRLDFLKADVEGMELPVLQGGEETIRKFRPVVYVENDRRDHSPALIAFLLSLGYDLYWHLPPLFNPENYFENAVNEFGGIVSVNMLGIHSSVKSAINGLKRVEGPQSGWRT